MFILTDKKQCSKCKNVKPIDEFGSNRSTKDGKNFYCKICANAIARESKKRNHENTLASLRKWRENNTGKVKDYSLKYYWKNRETQLDDNHKQKRRQYQEKNREKILGRKRKYYQENKEIVAEQQKAYANKNKEKLKEKNAAYYQKNKLKHSIKSLLYRLTHKKELSEAGKLYRQNNREKIRENKKKSKHIRRARMKGTDGSFTEAEWKSVLEKYGNKCLCCGSTENITKDHVLPLAMGGKNVIENIQPLCVSCNSKKHTKTIDYR